MSRLVGGVDSEYSEMVSLPQIRGSANTDYCKLRMNGSIFKYIYEQLRKMSHLDGVAVDDGPVLFEVLGSEAALVDDLHLLHDRTLPRLPRT